MADAEFHYEFEQAEHGRICIVIHGMLVGSSLPGLDEETLLGRVPDGSEVVVDLTDVVQCDPAACRVLARVQRRLGAQGCRTAWLASRPRIRGAAWWIVHAARDPQAMPVANARFAEEWLEQGGSRLDVLETGTGAALERATRAASEGAA